MVPLTLAFAAVLLGTDAAFTGGWLSTVLLTLTWVASIATVFSFPVADALAHAWHRRVAEGRQKP